MTLLEKPPGSTCGLLLSLREKLSLAFPEADLLSFLALLRWDYWQRERTPALKRILACVGVAEPSCPTISPEMLVAYRALAIAEGFDWGDWRFHSRARLHLNRRSSQADVRLAMSLLHSSADEEEAIRRIVLDGVQAADAQPDIAHTRYYDLSILPLNLLLGDPAVRYFIPPVDYFVPHFTQRADPYGIIRGSTRATSSRTDSTIIIDTKTGMRLGSHKFPHTLLLNLDFYCPIGCSDCYKARMGTREYIPGEHDTPVDQRLSTLQHVELLRPAPLSQMVQNASLTVRWLNEDPRGQQIYDVIISGGEPFWLGNDVIGAILSELTGARNLRILRFCTGCLFLGVPFRLDQDLLEMLEEFSESTGVRVTIHAHLGNDQMLSPEALAAVQRVRDKAISIYSQVPIKEGINFFLHDAGKTLQSLRELGRRQVIAGIEPYMFIVDMHPSTNAYYVPIEPLMQMWSMLVEGHDVPGLERPRTLSVLFEGGNIILSGHTLFAAKKEIDKSNDRVIYRIPRVVGHARWESAVGEVYEYDEPLIIGINDDPDSLERLRSSWFQSGAG